MRGNYAIRISDWRKLQRRARNAQRKDQSEVCGALVERQRVLELVFLRNVTDRCGSFEIHLAELAEVRRRARKFGNRVVGTFHSHPVSESIPSERDIAEAAGNSLMLVYDVCGAQGKLWRVIRRGTRELVDEQPFIVTASA